MDKKQPIGVFDSGVGGLTVLRNFIKSFPEEDFLYVGDTLYCPYGTKTKEQIENRVEAIIHYFEEQQVKAIVIACNTATANSYHIKSQIPILRIIEPAAQAALEVSKHIGVLATNYTIDSKAYDVFLKDKMMGVRCSSFVDIVEKGDLQTKNSYEVVKKTLKPLENKVDTIILGCTHFGLLLPEIQEALPNVNIIDSSNCLSPVLKKYLEENHLKNHQQQGTITITCTGNPKDIQMDWFQFPYQGVYQVVIER